MGFMYSRWEYNPTNFESLLKHIKKAFNPYFYYYYKVFYIVNKISVD